MANGTLSESRAVDLIRELIGEPGPGVEVGPGDDAAVFNFARGSVILTVDSMYEGIHFTLDAYGMADVGWKAMAASVSDVAAMGGRPACSLVSVAFGSPPTETDIRRLMGGIIEMAGWCHCPVIGGDICRSASGVGITVTVAGCPGPSGIVPRSGAREEDLVGVTGTLGDSAGGLFILGSGSDDLRVRYPGLVEAHLRPKPRLEAGEILASSGATAMEDVSDGLATDLVHICDESGTGCRIDSADIPVSPGLGALAREAGRDPLAWALGGGEDYELVFTMPPGKFDGAPTALAAAGVSVAVIGRIVPEARGRKLVAPDGKTAALEGMGYDHFR